jgi:hypothetical protein
MKTKILVLAALVASLSFAQRQLHIFYKNGTIGSIEESKLDSIVFNKNSAPDSLEGHSIVYHLNIPSDLQGGTVLGTSAGTYLPNTAIIVTAVPAAGYQFGGWRDDAKAAAATRTLTLTNDTTLTPIFVKTYNLSLSATDGGSVIGAKSGIYAEGTAVTVKAEPAVGYQFVQWSDGVTTAERAISLTSDSTLKAQFVKVCKVTLTATTGGSVSGATSDAVYTAGEALTLKAVPAEGYSFAGWSDGMSASVRTVTLTGDLTLQSKFEKLLSLIVPSVQGGAVLGTSAGTYLPNTAIIVTAVPSAGYQFGGWRDDAKAASATRTLTLISDTTLTPIFVKTYNLSLSASDGGSVIGAKSGIYAEGTDVTVKAELAAGYQFVQWSDGVKTAERTISLTSDSTLKAQFVKVCKVILTATDGGSVSGATSDAVYTAGEALTLKAVPAEGYSFAGWSDGVSDSVRTVTLTGNLTLQAKFEKLLSLIESSVQGGTVLGTSAGTYLPNTAIIVTAVPATGYQFGGWSDDAKATATRTLVLTSDTTLTPIFVKTYNLSLSASDGGSVIGAKSGTYAEGTEVTVNAEPAAGYQFVQWSDGAKAAERTIKIAENITLKAQFVKVCKVTLTATNGGSVSGATSDAVYTAGEALTLKAVPAEGYAFAGWSDGVSDSVRTVTLMGDLTLQSKFEKLLSLIVSSVQGGTVLGTSAGTYLPNTAIIVTAVPATGYQFGGWRDDAKASATRTLILTSDTTLTPIFVKTYNLSLSATDGGSIIGAKSGAYAEGTAVTVKAEPAAGYQFVQWSDGAKAAERTIPLTSDSTLKAQFVKVCKVTLTATDGGSVSGATSDAVYTAGEALTLKAVPAEGYAFAGWSDGVSDSVRTVTLTGDLTLQAKFEKLLSLVLPSVQGGTVLGTSAGTYLPNTAIIVTAVPAAGYQFGGWRDDAKATATRTLILKNDTTLTPIFVKTYNLSLSATDGGSIIGSKSGIYAEGTDVTVKAEPAAGYQFVQWSDGVTTAERTISLTSDSTLKAQFVKVCKVTLTATTGGSVSGTTSDAVYTAGEALTLKAVPAEGYSFAGWSDGMSDSVRTVKLTGDLSLQAKFEKLLLLIEPSVQGGTVLGTSAGTYLPNTAIIVTAVPAAGYQFGGWSDDAKATATRTLTLTSDTTLTPIFVKTYNLSLSASDGGSIIGSKSGIYAEGTDVTVKAEPAAGYQFVQWSDGVKTAERTISLTSDSTLKAQFVKVCKVTLTATDGGSVSGATSDAVYTAGEALTLKAVPAEGYSFAGWSDGVSDSVRTVTLTGNLTLQAKFEKLLSLIEPSVQGGAVLGTSAGTYLPNTAIIVTAVPAAGYQFGGWRDDAKAATATRILILKSDTTLTPIFVKTYNLSLSATDGGSVIGAKSGAYAEGTAVTVKAEPAAGYQFMQWSDGAKAAERTISLTSDSTLKAQFVKVCKVILTATTGGSVSGATSDAVYTAGEALTLKAVPAEGYSFAGWSDGMSDSVRTVTLTGDLTLQGKFEKLLSLIEPSVQGGAVLGTSAGTYLPNTAIIVTAVPAAGYQFGGWRDDAKAATATRTLILKNDTTLTPIFVKTYNLSLSATDGGSVIGAKSGIYAEGTAVTVKAEPAAGYQFVQWSDGAKVAERAISLTSDSTLKAQFVKVCKVTLTATDGGSVSGATSDAVYTAGEELTLKAVPAEGYSFAGWSDGVSDSVRTVKLTGDLTLQAKFEKLLSLALPSVQGGAVLGTSAGTYLPNTAIIVTAVPAAGYQFGGWRDDAKAAATRTLTLKNDTTLTPIFVKTYNLSLSATDGGSVIGAKSGAYAAGTAVTVKAEPAAGYQFVQWSDGVTTAERTISLTSDSTLKAQFVKVCKVTLTATTGGSVSGATSDAVYMAGEALTLKAVPAEGYSFAGWSDGVSDSVRTVTLTGDLTLQGKFEKLLSLIEPSVQGGTVLGTSAGTYLPNTAIIVTAVPATGYQFGGWRDDAKATATTRTLVLTSDTTLTPIFVKTYNLSLSASDGGSVIGSKSGTYAEGTAVTVKAEPAVGYQFVQWSDGVQSG